MPTSPSLPLRWQRALDVELHAGSDSDRNNKVQVELSTLTAAGLGIDKLASYNIGIVDSTGNNATDAIDVIADALNMSIQTAFCD